MKTHLTALMVTLASLAFSLGALAETSSPSANQITFSLKLLEKKIIPGLQAKPSGSNLLLAPVEICTLFTDKVVRRFSFSSDRNQPPFEVQQEIKAEVSGFIYRLIST